MMTASPSLYEKIKEFEGCASNSDMHCDGDVPTGGYGHISGVRPGQPISQQMADEWLREDVALACKVVNDLVEVPLRQGQFDALVDFTFNEGQGQFSSSTLLKLLNTGDYLGAANQFERWVYKGKEILPGLVKRRQWDYDTFLGLF